MIASPIRLILTVLVLLFTLPSGAAAQGVVLRSKAIVLYGESSNCTVPASVDMSKLMEKTPEYDEIVSQGIDPDSARYKLLAKAMLKRIKEACKAVAEDEGCDMVVRSGDVSNAKGLTLTDLTDKVVEYLEKNSDS